MDFQEIIAGTVGKENTFGTCVGRVKAGAMSFARYSTDDRRGVIRGYTGAGKFTDDPLETFGGAGVAEIPQVAEAAEIHLPRRLRASRGRQLQRCVEGRARSRVRYLGWESHYHRRAGRVILQASPGLSS